jgi:IS30 family transposase
MQSYSHLSEDERTRSAFGGPRGRSIGAIARALCRAKTTISRELQRNALPSGGYSPPKRCNGRSHGSHPRMAVAVIRMPHDLLMRSPFSPEVRPVPVQAKEMHLSQVG